MIEVQSISKRYGSFLAVRDLSFSVSRGEIIGLVGPNGAGKTTTMKIITGYLVPNDGRVLIDGGDVALDPVKAQERIGYLPESNPIYPEMSVQDYLLWMGKMRGLKGSRLVERLSYAVKACDIEGRLTSTVRTLSKGLRQRVGIAQAILHDPDILILDEPTSGLDPNQIIEIRDLIRDLGRDKTVILSTHILSEVEETCSRALMIVGGTLAVDDRIDHLLGDRTLHFRVAKAGDDTAELLRAVEGVEEVRPLDAAKDTRRFLVVPKDGIDLAPALFHLAVERGWELLELSPARRSLEDVFREATVSGGVAS
ncbi:MAG TPA: ATP-binding cassette domain-containing protein [Planctomycetes bacterium]|nr:ATP-binding cassette domain-containing protein [Planctomycetota bacterium]